MKKQHLTLLVLAISVSFSACAQFKKVFKKSNPVYAKHVESLRQRTLPGVRGSEPTEEQHHIVIWQGKQAPEAFYWRSTDAWMPCNVMKAHKIKTRGLGNDYPYTSEDIKMEKIKKGDTLELTPMPHGKYGMPKEIPQSASNTIFYKTANTKWLALPVKSFKKLPDIIMP